MEQHYALQEMLELGLQAQQVLGEKAKLQGQPTLATYGIHCHK
jgi:hypothetical protein